VPEIEAHGIEWADVYFGLRGASNLHEHDDISSRRLSLNQAAMGKISTLRWQKTRWCLVRVPNAAFAQAAEADEETIMEMFFAACLRDWRSEGERWRRWADRLGAGTRVRLVGKDTDLRFSVAGRSWLAADGRINMPDGEIMTAPVEDSVDGEVFFEFPGVLSGRLVHDIRLRFTAGRLVEATSTRRSAARCTSPWAGPTPSAEAATPPRSTGTSSRTSGATASCSSTTARC
jgi:aminopeptidase